MKKLKINEIVFIAVVSSAMGVFWWSYTFLYDLLKPFLKPLMLENLLTGVWLLGGLFFPFVIRKPGSALLGEMIAAFVQGFIARWGVTSLIWGFFQALPVEIFFLLLSYKKWNLKIMLIAGFLSSTASYLLSFVWEKWYLLKNIDYLLIQFIAFSVSGVFLGGLFAYILANGLKSSGIFNQFEIVRSEVDERDL